MNELSTLIAMLGVAMPAAAVGIAGEPVMKAVRKRTPMERKFMVDLRDPQTVAAGQAMRLAVQLTAASAIVSILYLFIQYYTSA